MKLSNSGFAKTVNHIFTRRICKQVTQNRFKTCSAQRRLSHRCWQEPRQEQKGFWSLKENVLGLSLNEKNQTVAKHCALSCDLEYGVKPLCDGHLERMAN